MNSQFGEIKKAKTILQYLEVFATDNIRQSAVPNGEQKEIAAKNISLLVTPDQYVLLDARQEQGTNLPGPAASRGRYGGQTVGSG